MNTTDDPTPAQLAAYAREMLAKDPQWSAGNGVTRGLLVRVYELEALVQSLRQRCVDNDERAAFDRDMHARRLAEVRQSAYQVGRSHERMGVPDATRVGP